MTKVMRQDRILEILEKENSANLEDLAQELNVSMVTLRRDVSELYKRGLIEKFCGGIKKGINLPKLGLLRELKSIKTKKKKWLNLLFNLLIEI